MKKVALLLVLWCVVLIPTLEGYSKDDLVSPFRNDLELCKEVLLEITRQGEHRLKEIEQWKTYFEGCKKELAANIQRLKEEQTRRKDADNKISSAHGSLALDDKGNAHVPHHGWGVPGQIQARTQETNRVIAEENETFGKGEMGFHYAGTGWLTEKQLNATIANHAKQMTDLQKQMQDGEFSIHFPGVGWINQKQAKARIEDNEKKVTDTLAVIEKGEFSIHLPHLGWLTRNQLQAQITASEEELAKFRASLTKEDLSIHRPLFGWSTLAQLHANMEGKKKAVTDLEASVSAKDFSHHIPTMGWVNGKALQTSIESIEKEIADVQKLLGDKKYGVPLSTGGWADATGIHEALKAPQIEPATRAALNKGLAHIPIAAQADMAVRHLELNKRKTWLGAIGIHAIVHIEKIKLELAQLANSQSEYSDEVTLNQKRIERHIAWLKQNLTVFP